MKKWLSILMLSLLGYVDASPPLSFQTNYSEFSNIQNKDLEDLKITIVGFNYLKSLNIETTNIPNGCPIELNGFKRISDYFGMRNHPIKKRKLMHYGIDLSGIRKTKVFTTGDGIIEKAKYSYSYGNMVIVNHGNNIKTLYSHLNNISVKEGQVVIKGDVIGKLGNTGISTGPHLHYEVIVNKKRINPLYLYSESNNLSNIEIKKILKNRYDEQRRYNYNKNPNRFIKQ